MQKIIIDTNALMAITQFRVDIFAELERTLDMPFQFEVLSGTIDELHKISLQQTGKYKLAAQLALDLISSKKISVEFGRLIYLTNPMNSGLHDIEVIMKCCVVFKEVFQQSISLNE